MTRWLFWISSGVPGGDQFAEVNDVDAVGNVHDEIHVVLDEQDGHVELVADAADELGELVRLLRVHAGSRLVEHQELRMRRQRAGDLQPALLAVGQRRRQLVLHILQTHDAREAP